MQISSSVHSQPITLSASTEGQVYSLVALAMGLTLIGVYLGGQFASVLLTSGMHFILLIAELAIIFTARFWMDRHPLNYVLFGLFPLLSGITVTPYLLYVLQGYANGTSILINAVASTVFLTAAAAVFARTTRWNLAGLAPGLILALIGLIVLGILQLFIPGMRTGLTELMIAGAGVVIFALFTAMDIQRLSALGRMGANPFLLALHLYLDMFNLFLYVLRLMLALSGNRRS